jgi:hypothetical protein
MESALERESLLGIVFALEMTLCSKRVHVRTLLLEREEVVYVSTKIKKNIVYKNYK